MMKGNEFSTYIIKFSGLYGRLVLSYNAMILPTILSNDFFSSSFDNFRFFPLQLIMSPPAMITRREISLSLSLSLLPTTWIYIHRPNYIYRTSQPTLLSLFTQSPSDQQHNLLLAHSFSRKSNKNQRKMCINNNEKIIPSGLVLSLERKQPSKRSKVQVHRLTCRYVYVYVYAS
jgi:hypothetical protein